MIPFGASVEAGHPSLRRTAMRKIGTILVLAALISMPPICGSAPVAAAQSEWSVVVTACTTSEGSNLNLEFGTATGATDSFDSGIDLPHPPYPTTFDAYFQIDHILFPRLDRDYREQGDAIEWVLHIESSVEEIAVSWDASAVPGDVTLWLTGAGVQKDMKAVCEAILPPGAANLVIATQEPSPVGSWDLALDEGWNLVSLPLIPFESDVEALLADVATSVASVWSYEAATRLWSSYVPDGPLPTLTHLVDGKGYWIAMDAPDTLRVEGRELPAPPSMPPTYEVVEGWNLIGFKSCISRTVDDYLAGVGGYTVVQGYAHGDYFRVLGPEYMEPGHGYWVAVTGAGTIYP